MYANTDVYSHPCSAVSRILKTRNLLQILTKSSRLLWPPTSSQRQLGGQLFFITKLWRVGGCDDNDYFFVHVVTIVRNAQTTVASSFGLHFRCDWWLDPSPQHRSCSFRFKWLELIVPWGSSVIFRPGTLLLLLLNKSRCNHIFLKIVKRTAFYQFFELDNEQDGFWKRGTCFIQRIHLKDWLIKFLLHDNGMLLDGRV